MLPRRAPVPRPIGAILVIIGAFFLVFSAAQWRSASADLAVYRSAQCPCSDQRVTITRVRMGHGGKNTIPDRLSFERADGEPFPIDAFVHYGRDVYVHAAGQPVTIRVFKNAVTEISGAYGTAWTESHPRNRLNGSYFGIAIGLFFIGSGIVAIRRARSVFI